MAAALRPGCSSSNPAPIQLPALVPKTAVEDSPSIQSLHPVKLLAPALAWPVPGHCSIWKVIHPADGISLSLAITPSKPFKKKTTIIFIPMLLGNMAIKFQIIIV